MITLPFDFIERGPDPGGSRQLFAFVTQPIRDEERVGSVRFGRVDDVSGFLSGVGVFNFNRVAGLETQFLRFLRIDPRASLQRALRLRQRHQQIIIRR